MEFIDCQRFGEVNVLVCNKNFSSTNLLCKNCPENPEKPKPKKSPEKKPTTQTKLQADSKVTFSLWWECLKRHKGYKAFCDQKRKRQAENPSLPEAKETHQDKYQHSLFEDLFERFGDIYNTSFNNWWKDNKEKIRETVTGDNVQFVFERVTPLLRVVRVEKAESKPNLPIQDYSQLIQNDFDKCIDSLKRHNQGREPTVHEFMSAFLRKINVFSPNHVFLKVDFTQDTDILKEEFAQIIKEHKERTKPIRDKIEVFQKQGRMPIDSKITAEDINHCLNVYDLREKDWEWSNIMDKFPLIYKERLVDKKNKDNVDEESKERLVKLHRQKAKKLIENAGLGWFPLLEDSLKKPTK